MNESNVMNWIKKDCPDRGTEAISTIRVKPVEMDELFWFLECKPRTQTRETICIMTMVSREPQQIIGPVVSRDKNSGTIQKIIDAAPDAERYCTDGYSGYLDAVFPGKHIFNIHNKNTPSPWRASMLICAMISLLWHGAADVFRKSWKTSKLP